MKRLPSAIDSEEEQLELVTAEITVTEGHQRLLRQKLKGR